jgi:hypothetical protein
MSKRRAHGAQEVQAILADPTHILRGLRGAARNRRSIPRSRVAVMREMGGSAGAPGPSGHRGRTAADRILLDPISSPSGSNREVPMRHYLFAVFDDTHGAQRALRDLHAAGTRTEHCGAILHRDHMHNEELPIGETSSRQGAVVGAVSGGALGAALGGLVLGPLGLVAAGALAAALMAGAYGAAGGALFGAIGGAGSPDRTLEGLADELRAGKVLLTIETPDAECLDRADRVLQRAGGRVVHRPPL